MTLEETQHAVAGHMDEILGYFKLGRKITVLVRSPDLPDGDFLMTSDTPDEILAAIQRRKDAHDLRPVRRLRG